MKKYDIIVIGAGSGGLNIAGFMNKAGFKVLLIDKSDKSIGGDCLNFGCVPSKALIHVAKLVYEGRKSKEFGLNISGKVNLKKVKNYIQRKQEIIRKHENAEYFRKQGMDVILGKAQLTGNKEVEVNGVVYSGKKIVIATGSRPRKIQIPGIEKVDYLTNENIFDLEKLPGHLIVIGVDRLG